MSKQVKGYGSDDPMKQVTRAAPVVLLALVAAACSGTPPAVRPPARAVALAAEGSGIQEPVPAEPPRIAAKDSPVVRAQKLAAFIHARWPRVRLSPDANAYGTLAAFAISIQYDRYAGDEEAWEASVHQVSGDLHEASVELLQLSAQYFPKLRWASVWEDRTLIFFWSTEQIRSMGSPSQYRDFEAFQALTRLAAFQPPLLERARAEEPPMPSIVG